MLLNPLLHLRHWVLASHHHRYFITAKFAVLFCPGVDSFHFRAAWILSTRLLSVVGFVLRWSGFFPLKCPSAQVSRGPKQMELLLSNCSSNASSCCGWVARWMLLFFRAATYIVARSLSTLTLGISVLVSQLQKQDRRCSVRRWWIHSRGPVEVTNWRSMEALRVSAESL